MDIICKKLANEMFYAYHKGRFWRWDDARGIWKESHLMTQKFERAKAAIATLTPEDFLSGAEFEQPDEYELDFAMVDALKSAKPCKTAQIEPVEEAQAQDTPAVPVPTVQEDKPAAPAFDFSALGDLSEQATEADQQFDLHYGTAQDEYLISCIYLARIHTLTAKAGRYGGGTWTKWCESKGISEGSARTMVQNGDAFNSATVAELKQLPTLTRKDLNLIARSGRAEQLTAAAGDSERVQELLAQIKAKDDAIAAEKDRADTAEHQLEAAQADVAGLKERVDSAEAREEEAWKMQSKAEARAKTAEEALKKQPLVGVTDKDEVQRQAKVLASQWSEEEIDKLATDKAWGIADARNAELQAEKNEVEQRNAELEQQLAKAQVAPSVDPQEYIEVVEGGRINMDGTYNMIRPAFKHLIGIGESFDKMAEDMIALCNHIRDDMVEMIIENDKVTQYE